MCRDLEKLLLRRNWQKKLNAVVLNSDAIRISMWGSVEKIKEDRTSPETRELNNQLTFGAMDYATNQILRIGISVIYDSNANKQHNRLEKYAIATKNQVLAVTVRIKVPRKVALERTQARNSLPDQRQLSAQQATDTIDRLTNEIEEPSKEELIVEIDGRWTFDKQYEVFNQKPQSINS